MHCLFSVYDHKSSIRHTVSCIANREAPLFYQKMRASEGIPDVFSQKEPFSCTELSPDNCPILDEM